MKEILTPSNTCFSNEDQPQNENEHVDEINGSYPCVYCNILRKTESNQFKSNSNGQIFNIRQNINCQSENVVYLIWCKGCKLQGVGCTLKMNTKLSNYHSHIKQKRRTCSSVNHFIDRHANNWKDVVRIMGIVKLTNFSKAHIIHTLKHYKVSRKVSKKTFFTYFSYIFIYTLYTNIILYTLYIIHIYTFLLHALLLLGSF